MQNKGMTLPLLNRLPGLGERLQPLSLCNLPTPLVEVAGPGSCPLLIKRDDLSADAYGGNKVRKLEFLLADALRQGSRSVLTFGFAGSNFAAATAWYARQQGLDCVSLLLPQAPEPYVRSNLLLQQASGGKCVQRDTTLLLGIEAIRQMLAGRLSGGLGAGRWPYWIPAGGSSPVGVLGFVNAALELQLQLEAARLPAPTDFYLAMGSMGSVAGLAIGMALAGMQTRIVATRVVESRFAGEHKLRALLAKTLTWLRPLHASLPDAEALMQRIEIRNDHFGAGYGIPSAGDRAAMAFLKDGGMPADPAYTAKAMCCLLEDLRGGRLANARPCFWLTCNGRSLQPLTRGADWRRLPAVFHGYFDEPAG